MKGVIAVVTMVLVIAASSPMLEIGCLLLSGFILVVLDILDEVGDEYAVSIW